ncbi:hypothetical protein [Actinomadura parmotrematis]|uniref:Peptidase inhibitor family I36 protein n=1 Tax=Actinomadura parmotrematis TaxID=2864039 RepID=A0ABS7G0J1_9ACTN|nr:hypothetical protein [Actinomadura parmotrematis]MBW8486197.1 hypothetical protein [Actinomadura parmotrematis]
MLAGLPLAATAIVVLSAGPAAADVKYGKDYVAFCSPGLCPPNYPYMCQGWMEVRASDGYVRGVWQSSDLYAVSCKGWLERKTYSTDGTVKQNWTKVTNYYFVNSDQDRSGYHWNGTNAGTRICAQVIDSGQTQCSTGVW